MRAKLARFITVFFCGFLLMLTISIFNDWTYEREMLSNLRDHVYSKCQSRDITTVVDTALYYSHMLQEPATNIYFGKKFHSLKQYLVPSSFQNFYFGADVCGAYSAFFVRLMSSAGYRAQITQLNIRYKKNAHMVVCIFADNKMYVVDPLFGHDFKGPDGKLSDIHSVSKNWYTYYSKHVPAGYQELYNYQYGWSFTNWGKFGAVSKSIYKMLCFVIGKDRVDTFSFRHYTQGHNKFFWLFSFVGFLFTLIHAIRLSFNHSLKEYMTFRYSKLINIFKKPKTDP